MILTCILNVVLQAIILYLLFKAGEFKGYKKGLEEGFDAGYECLHKFIIKQIKSINNENQNYKSNNSQPGRQKNVIKSE